MFTSVFGISIKYEAWNQQDSLPVYIAGSYDFHTAYIGNRRCIMLAPREASEMFQCIKYEDKREVFGLKIHSFSTLDKIKKYDGSDNEENAEKPYSIEVGEIERTINLYAIASTKFQVAV